MTERGGGAGGAGRDARPRIVATREVFRGRVVDLRVEEVRYPDGGVHRFEVVRHRGAAAVVPLLGSPTDPDPEVVLVRQYRHAAGEELYEIPAGLPGEGEGWEACARRELEEETGYRAGELHHLADVFTTPGFTDEVVHLFLATELSDGTAGGDPEELIRVVRMPLSRVLDGIRSGAIRDAKTLAGVLYTVVVLRDGG